MIKKEVIFSILLTAAWYELEFNLCKEKKGNMTVDTQVVSDALCPWERSPGGYKERKRTVSCLFHCVPSDLTTGRKKPKACQVHQADAFLDCGLGNVRFTVGLNDSKFCSNLNNSVILWTSGGVLPIVLGLGIFKVPFNPKPSVILRAGLGCCGPHLLWVLVPRSRFSIFVQAVAEMKLVVSIAACMRLCSGFVTKNIGYTAVFWLLLSSVCQHQGFLFVLLSLLQ